MDKETREMFELVLDKLEGMEKRQEDMGKRQEDMGKRQEDMGKRQEGMGKRQESMEKRLESMEKRQDEIFEVVKAIEHSNNTHKAEIDNLTYRIVHVEGTVNGVAEFIQGRKAQ